MLEEKVKEALRKQILARQANTAAFTAEASPAPAVEPEVKRPEVKVGKGQVLFSKLVGKRLPKSLIDFAVTVLDKASLPAEVAAFVPALRTGYNMDLEAAHALIMGWECGDRTLITGPTGSGKSTLNEHCCALTGRPMLRVNMTGDIESSVLFGSLVVESGATVWKDGPVTEAVRYGAVMMLDEWDVTPPEILFGLQWLLEDGGKLFLKEMPGDATSKFIVPHANFRIVCLGNTVGQGDDSGRYSGTNVQNNASIDRFQTTIVLNYMDPADEARILNDNCKGLDATLIKKMVSFGNLVRTAAQQNGINLTMSPRTLINWGNKCVVLGDSKAALRRAFANKLRESDHKIVDDFHRKVFGSPL